MVEYVRSNKITDILFANNIFNAYNPKFCVRYEKFLTQGNQTHFTPSAEPVSHDHGGNLPRQGSSEMPSATPSPDGIEERKPDNDAADGHQTKPRAERRDSL